VDNSAGFPAYPAVAPHLSEMSRVIGDNSAELYSGKGTTLFGIGSVSSAV
jgi:hypothetical protein